MAAEPKDRNVLPRSRFARRQKIHFTVCVVVPTILAVGIPVYWAGPIVTAPALGIGLFMWFLVGGLGISVGFHRHFSHRAFAAHPALRATLGVLGSMAAQGPVTYWLSIHRSHHARSDQMGDGTHSIFSLVSAASSAFGNYAAPFSKHSFSRFWMVTRTSGHYHV